MSNVIVIIYSDASDNAWDAILKADMRQKIGHLKKDLII